MRHLSRFALNTFQGVSKLIRNLIQTYLLSIYLAEKEVLLLVSLLLSSSKVV